MTERRIRVKLDSPADIRAELGKIYRKARMGEITTEEHSKLANTLYIILRTFKYVGLDDES